MSWEYVTSNNISLPCTLLLVTGPSNIQSSSQLLVTVVKRLLQVRPHNPIRLSIADLANNVLVFFFLSFNKL